MAAGRPLVEDARSIRAHIGPKRSTRSEGPRTEGPDRAIARLAGGQHGVVGRRQLLAAGLSEGQIKGRLRRGWLHRVHQGVYAVGHRALGAEGRWMAAVLACGDGAALSHRSAGRAWGMLGSWNGPIEVTRASGWRPPAEVRAHRGELRCDEIAAVDGIPVTGVSRTLLDLAAVVSRSQLERAMNEAEVLGLTDRLSIPDLLERYPRRQGSAALRALLRDEAALRGVLANDFEAAFAALLGAHGLPRPRFNADLAVRGRFIRPDAMWEGARVIVELDGRAAHGTRRAFEGDRERDRLLLVEGWRVIRVTWRQLREEPEAVAADLREVLDEAAASTL